MRAQIPGLFAQPAHFTFRAPQRFYGLGAVADLDQAGVDLDTRMFPAIQAGDAAFAAMQWPAALLSYKQAGLVGLAVGAEIDNLGGARTVTAPIVAQATAYAGQLAALGLTEKSDAEFARGYASQMYAAYTQAILDGKASLGGRPNPPPSPQPSPQPSPSTTAKTSDLTVPVLIGAGVLGLGIIGYTLLAKPSARAVRHAAREAAEEARDHADRSKHLYETANELSRR